MPQKDGVPKTWQLKPCWDGELLRSAYPLGDFPFQDWVEPGYFAQDYIGPGATPQLLAGAAAGSGQAAGALSTGPALAGAAPGSAFAAGSLAQSVPLAGAAAGAGALAGALEAPAVAGAALTSFTLTRATSGTGVPFSLAQPFAKGDVPPWVVLTLDSASYQCTPITLWDDGSVKLAKISGTANLTANVPLTVTYGRGSAPSGTTLAESNLIAAAPTASVTFGTAGTISLTSLLGTSALKITENAGPVFAEFQYVADFPSDATRRAVFYVKLWAGGSYRVRVAVETGRPLDAYGGAGTTGTCTITIAGTQVLNQSVTQLPGNRFDAEGGSFTEPTPLHDAAYLRSTKLFPNYGYTAPSATALNALSSAYTPLGLGGWEANMGGAGYAQAIGLLPHWDAMYLTSGDARARAAVIAQDRAYGCYGVFWRDATTHRMPKPGDYSTAYSGGEDINQQGNGGYRWEMAHHPNAGYLPWLITGDRFHLETLQANAWTVFYTNPPSGGVSRIYNSQTRGRAWRFRTISACAAVSPTGDTIGADYRTNAAANVAQWKIDRVDTGLPGTGLVGTWSDLEPGTAGFQVSIFESMFMVASLAFAWDIEPGFAATDKTKHQQVRDFSYKGVVGLLGRGAASGEYNWRRATGPYRMTIGPDSSLANIYNTWGEVETATWGDSLAGTDGLTILDSYADDVSSFAFPQGNWGHILTAISYATEHGAAGAQTCLNRLTGASNWNANAIKWNDWPAYGVLPRFRASYAIPNPGEAVLIGTNTAEAIRPSGMAVNDFGYAVFNGYGGGVFAKDYSVAGAYAIAGQGGHQAPGVNDAVLFDFTDATWKLLPNTASAGAAKAHYIGLGQDIVNGSAEMTNDGWGEIVSAQPAVVPLPSHLYMSLAYLPKSIAGNSKGSLVKYVQSAVTTLPTRIGAIHRMDLASGAWSRVANGSRHASGGDFTFERNTFLDEVNGRLYVTGEALHAFAQFEYLRLSDNTIQLSAGYGNPTDWTGGGFHMTWFDAPRRLILDMTPSRGLRALQIDNFAAGWTILTTSGTPFNEPSKPAYYPPTGNYYFRASDATDNTLYRLVPPAGVGAAAGAGTWAWSTITVTGAALPAYTNVGGNNARHYQNLIYVPAINSIAWVCRPNGQIPIFRPGS